MSRRSEVLKLPVPIRCELDDRLRAAAYGEYVGVAEWLTEKGYSLSKSSIHRYGQTLRGVDATQGDQDAMVGVAKLATGTRPTAVRDALLFELGRLRYQECKLLAQIAQLDSGTM